VGGGWLSALAAPAAALAQTELHNETAGIWRAEVVEVLKVEERNIPGTETSATWQTVRAQVLDGPQTGDIITVQDDYLGLDTGERFYYSHTVFINDDEAYGVLHRDRSFELFVLIAIFVVAVVALSGWQGVRSLISLVGSFAAIFVVLLPAILAGWNPLLMSIIVAAIVLFGAIYFTHG